MSVQLSLYPQNYQGEYNVLSYGANEVFVNGVNFDNLSSATSTSFANINFLTGGIVTTTPAVIPNTWYRFRMLQSGSSYPDYPTNVGGNATFYADGTDTTISGIYQRVTDLTVGQNYTVKITGTNVSNFLLGVRAQAQGYNSSTNVGSVISESTSTTRTFTFEATWNTLTVVIYFISTPTLTAVLNSVSLSQTSGQPSFAINELGDGQVICDLYEDEDMPLTFSVDDFKNSSEKVQSYSKAFKLPATKRNNQIFDNIFEITRETSGIAFNPYVRTKAILKQDGFDLFTGYLRLIDIQNKEGEISYNVNLYSEVIALADVLKDRKFSDLDFSELSHPYNFDEIRNSWQGILETNDNFEIGSFAGTAGTNVTNVIRYPFVNWTGTYAMNDNGIVLPNLESSFRPFISLKYLLNRIFEQTPFSFTSSMFDSETFNSLYMDFNWGSDDTPNDVSITGTGVYETAQTAGTETYATTSYTNIVFTEDTFGDEFGYNSSTRVFTCPSGQENSTFKFSGSVRTRNVLNDATINFRWIKNEGTSTEEIIDLSETFSTTGMAAAYHTTSLGVVTGITVQYGGNYASTPTVTMPTTSPFASGFAGTAVMSGTAVDSVTITNAGTNYNVMNSFVSFNSKNPTDAIATYTFDIEVPMEPSDTLELQFKASANNCIQLDNFAGGTNFQPPYSSPSTSIGGTVSILGVTTNTILQSLRGDLGQWEFLKGIMTMFNLISIPDESNPNNIKFEPYNDIFLNNSESTQLNWTDKIDVAEMKLTPLTDLNKTTIFKFVEDDDDYPFHVYKNAVKGHLYGSKVLDGTTASAGQETILQGTKEIVAEPFAASVVMPILEQYPDFIVPAIYSHNADDGASEGFDNSPRIMFLNGEKFLTSSTYFVPTQNGVAGDNTKDSFLQMSHLTPLPSSTGGLDFHFGECQLIPPVGNSPINNLYYTYWSPYFNELYNPDTRTMTLKVNLAASDISGFNFFDTIIIKNREFRVNKIDYKPHDLSTVEFILIP